MSVDLASVDLVRERMRCTYEEAQKALQAAGKVSAKTGEIIVAALIDYDRQDQFRLWRWLGLRQKAQARQTQEGERF